MRSPRKISPKLTRVQVEPKSIELNERLSYQDFQIYSEHHQLACNELAIRNTRMAIEF